MRLTVELTKRLNSLMKELSTVNFRELASDFNQIISEADSQSPPQENLQDPEYIKIWFRVKVEPLPHYVPTALLSCLSTKNFSCSAYQSLVAEFSKREHHQHYYYPDYNVYQHFIYPFLMHHNNSGYWCISSANESEWMIKNFGVYLRFAPITDLYRLYPNFSGLKVLHLLTPHQIAEMMLLPLPTPPEKDVVINRIFDFLFESPYERQLESVLSTVAYLSYQDPAPCTVYEPM
ncbi:uncharacterized protein LOC131960857 [Centropristis striata]|uniref:uncharacterized protein LOC131960857 n=1 Tax=Centropristis striata TaxID=184440 RepID=UPI0027E18207|nr:uncharacterized protein LOC131960857 [Centropristis striata]